MIKKIRRKIHNIKFYEEKKRFLLFSVLLVFALFFSFYLFQRAYAYYQSHAALNIKVDKAIYLLESSKMNFNIDSNGIIPSDDEFVYSFSISNYKDDLHSDIDIEYDLVITTTTNLPITLKLYRNTNYTDAGASSILSEREIKHDVDGSWYYIYKVDGTYEMKYSDDVMDYYTLVVDFPKIYSTSLIYADAIENIEVSISSRQIV